MTVAKYKEGDKVEVVRLVLTEEDQDYEYLEEYVGTLGEVGKVVGIEHEPVDQHDQVYLIALGAHPDGQGHYSEYELVDPDQPILPTWGQAEAEVDRLLAKANESPSLEGRLRAVAAFFNWAAEIEHAKRAGVWHIIAQARNLAQVLHVGRPVA